MTAAGATIDTDGAARAELMVTTTGRTKGRAIFRPIRIVASLLTIAEAAATTTAATCIQAGAIAVTDCSTWATQTAATANISRGSTGSIRTLLLSLSTRIISPAIETDRQHQHRSEQSNSQLIHFILSCNLFRVKTRRDRIPR